MPFELAGRSKWTTRGCSVGDGKAAAAGTEAEAEAEATRTADAKAAAEGVEAGGTTKRFLPAPLLVLPGPGPEAAGRLDAPTALGLVVSKTAEEGASRGR